MDIDPGQLFNQKITAILNDYMPEHWIGGTRVIHYMGNMGQLLRYNSNSTASYTLEESAGVCFYSGVFSAYTEEIRKQQSFGISSPITPDGVKNNTVFTAAVPRKIIIDRLPYADKDAIGDISMDDVSYQYIFGRIFEEQSSQFCKCGYDLQKAALIFLTGLGNRPTISLCGAFGGSFYDKLVHPETCGFLIGKHINHHKDGFLYTKKPGTGIKKSLLFDENRYYWHTGGRYIERR